MKYKHPAWSLENGFPEPGKDEDGNYTSEGNFVGIIDNLVILILRTTHRKYYAGYINAEGMPTEWPHGIGLECIFEGERRGVINLAKYMQIRIFPEKVIKYLWDDAFKFNPEALFDTDTMDDLEKVIRTFVLNTGKDRFKIFRQAVRDSLYPQS